MAAARRVRSVLAALALAGCAANPEPGARVAGPIVAGATAPIAETSVVLAPPAAVAPVVNIAEAAAETPAETEALRTGLADPAGKLSAYVDALKAASCTAGAAREAAEEIGLSAKRVPLQTLNPARRIIGALTYRGGFHLTSPDTRFGGLSGLDVLEDGGLLAVSDAGDFIWIDLEGDGVTPKAARIAALRDKTGEKLRGKADGDAEGVAVAGGMALVSFERNHRVLAYDVEACGGAARGAPIVFGPYGRSLPDAFKAAGLSVGGNEGPEALAVSEDWFLLNGVEALDDGAGPLSVRPIEAAPDFDLRVAGGAPALVGLDVVAAGADGRDLRGFSLHRGQDRLLGSPIVISETYLQRTPGRSVAEGGTSEMDARSRDRFRVTSQRTLAEMGLLQTIDNFEGLAARELSDGTVRLYVVSDDNFSARQRTLLMVFDVAK